LGLFSEYRVSYHNVALGSRSDLIGHITLNVKCAGARSAGNPHATCEVAGAGIRFTVRLPRNLSPQSMNQVFRVAGLCSMGTSS
jgi:hypothetical protein